MLYSAKVRGGKVPATRTKARERIVLTGTPDPHSTPRPYIYFKAVVPKILALGTGTPMRI